MKVIILSVLFLLPTALSYGQVSQLSQQSAQEVFNSLYKSLDKIRLRPIVNDSNLKIKEIEKYIKFLDGLKNSYPLGDLPNEFVISLYSDSRILESAAESSTSDDYLRLLNEASEDLRIKYSHWNKKDGSVFDPGSLGFINSFLVDVTVYTRYKETRVGGYEVWFTPRGLIDNQNTYRRFPKPTGPTTNKLAPGLYLIWVAKGDVETDRALVTIGGNGRRTQEIELLVPVEDSGEAIVEWQEFSSTFNRLDKSAVSLQKSFGKTDGKIAEQLSEIRSSIRTLKEKWKADKTRAPISKIYYQSLMSNVEALEDLTDSKNTSKKRFFSGLRGFAPSFIEALSVISESESRLLVKTDPSTIIGEVAIDLRIKVFHCIANSGRMEKVSIEINTIENGKIVNGYKVSYAVAAKADNDKNWIRFSEVSSPIKAWLAPGNYKMRVNQQEPEPLSIGAAGNPQETIDLVVK